MKLKITEEMQNKIKYLLKKFPKNEWSGPAFYKVKIGKNGFPKEYELKYFKPIDLGGSVDTEFSGELLNSFIPKIWKERPETKSYACGLIHSHHGMGAYFSETDTDQMEESVKDSQAEEHTFYPSLVVSYAEGKRYHFGIAYKDMYNYISIVEANKKDIIELGKKDKIPKEWKDEVDFIVAEDKKKPTSLFGLYKHKYTRNSKPIITNRFQENLFTDNNNQSNYFLNKIPRDLTDFDKSKLSTDFQLLTEYYSNFNKNMWGLEEKALLIMEDIISSAEDNGIIDEATCIELTNNMYDGSMDIEDTGLFNDSFYPEGGKIYGS